KKCSHYAMKKSSIERINSDRAGLQTERELRSPALGTLRAGNALKRPAQSEIGFRGTWLQPKSLL
ncbi:MAG TPA: hypothetical protein PKX67_07795, partial [Anaerolineaceae bacterium]|nr:hypothetical protein [Anaerolineaceae bacterium]